MNRNSRARYERLTTAALVLAMTHSACAQLADWPRERVVAVLRHREESLKSLQCTVTCTVEPTASSEIGKLQAYWRSKGDQTFGKRQITGIESARRTSFVDQYLREGRRERVDRQRAHAAADSITKRTAAFDGQVVRSYESAGGETRGSIHTEDGAHWRSSLEANPYAFLCEFTRLYPLSEVVESASSYQAAERDDRRGDGVRIALVDARFGEKLELDLDRSGRLVERRCLGKGLERHAFGDFRAITGVDGSTVDVPTRVVYSYCTGPLADGTYATWQTRTFELTDIKLNEDIPDHVFAPPFPPGIEVYDGLHGLGWIKSEDVRSTPPEPTPEPLAWRWGTIYIGLPILLLLLGAIVAWMRVSR